MDHRLSKPPAPCIEIDSHLPEPRGPRFFSVYLHLVDGTQRTLWLGMNYETAILKAEKEARSRHGPMEVPLPVYDQVCRRH